jgi:hypothetical protein
MASSTDKTLPIQVHETWPVVTGPPCPGPWTGNQEPGLADHRAGIVDLLSVLPVHCGGKEAPQ